MKKSLPALALFLLLLTSGCTEPEGASGGVAANESTPPLPPDAGQGAPDGGEGAPGVGQNASSAGQNASEAGQPPSPENTSAAGQEPAPEEPVIVKGPTGPVSKYKGLWLPFLDETKAAAEGIESLKADGINTVAIGIRLLATDEAHGWEVGNITEYENETEILEAINVFHENGIRVILVPNPAHGNFGVSPYPSEQAGKEFLRMHEPLILKWANLSEQYGVHMFCPVNEPTLLAGEEEVSSWAQELLPKIRSLYHGKVAFRVQDEGETFPAYNLSGYDYVLPMATFCTSDMDDPDPNCAGHLRNSNLQKMEEFERIYPSQSYIFFDVGAFTGPDYYSWEPIAPENQAKSSHEWPDDFFVVSEEGQAECLDMLFSLGWEDSDGYILSGAKGFEFMGKPAEEVVRDWFGGGQAD